MNKLRKYSFFAEELAPNGTSSLIITDEHGDVIYVLDEFLFGPPLNRNGNGHVFEGAHVMLGDSVIFVEDVNQAMVSGLELEYVYPIALEQVIDYIAESPVHSRLGQLKRLAQAVRKAS